jgi:hypothetical protein
MQSTLRMACLGLGFLVASLLLLLIESVRAASTQVGEIAYWAADRDASQLYGLDENLLLVRRAPLGWPLDLEQGAEGALVALRSGNAGTQFGQRLCWLDAQAQVQHEIYIEKALDLAVQQGRAALLVEERVEAPSNRRLLRINSEGQLFVLGEGPAWSCICAWRDQVVAGSSQGAIQILGGPAVALNASIRDLVAWGERLYALDGAGAGRLLCFDRQLTLLWSTDLGLNARHLALSSSGQVWIADTQLPWVRRYGPGGNLELERTDLPLLGLDRVLPCADGGALLCAPGAILRLSSTGQTLPGQGGFQFLSDLCRS